MVGEEAQEKKGESKIGTKVSVKGGELGYGQKDNNLAINSKCISFSLVLFRRCFLWSWYRFTQMPLQFQPMVPW